MVFVVVTVLVVAVTAYVLGLLLLGNETVAHHRRHQRLGRRADARPSSSGRTLLALAYAMLCMLGVAAIALFLSTVAESPLAAALGTMAIFVASSLLFTLDAASSFAPYLPTRYWLAFVDLFRDPILWRDVVRGTAAPGRLRRGVPGPGLGQLRDQGRRRTERSRPSAHVGGRHGGRPATQLGLDDRDHRGRARDVGVLDAQARAHLLHGEVDGPLERAGGGRHDGGVVGGPDRDPLRARRRLVVGVERGEQVGVGGELRARGGARSSPRSLARPATSVPWCGEARVTTRRASEPPPSCRPTAGPRPRRRSSRPRRPTARRGRRSAAPPRRTRRAWAARSPVPAPGGSTSRYAARGLERVGQHLSEAVLPP